MADSIKRTAVRYQTSGVERNYAATAEEVAECFTNQLTKRKGVGAEAEVAKSEIALRRAEGAYAAESGTLNELAIAKERLEKAETAVKAPTVRMTPEEFNAIMKFMTLDQLEQERHPEWVTLDEIESTQRMDESFDDLIEEMRLQSRSSKARLHK